MLEPYLGRAAVKLPDNHNFGLIFALVFGAAGGYSFYSDAAKFGLSFSALAATMLGLALMRPSALKPLNYFWYLIGTILGRITSMVTITLVFFLVFTPIGLVQRIVGRDILQLRSSKQLSYWKEPDIRERSDHGFGDQF
jgi:hypothetical protein